MANHNREVQASPQTKAMDASKLMSPCQESNQQRLDCLRASLQCFENFQRSLISPESSVTDIKSQFDAFHEHFSSSFLTIPSRKLVSNINHITYLRVDGKIYLIKQNIELLIPLRMEDEWAKAIQEIAMSLGDIIQHIEKEETDLEMCLENFDKSLTSLSEKSTRNSSQNVIGMHEKYIV